MLLDILIRTLGKPKHTHANASTLDFNCPRCAEENGEDAADCHHGEDTIPAKFICNSPDACACNR